MPKEYIEREALEEKLCALVREYNVRGEEEKASGAFEALYRTRLLQAIEAYYVIHGEWIICSDGYYPYCSVCKEEPENRKMTKFCPNCGAVMDKNR